MTVPDAGEVRDWITQKVADYVELPVGDLQPDQVLTELGLDSVYATALCGDIEDRFGLVVEPTVVWDHPTIDALAIYLGGELVQQHA